MQTAPTAPTAPIMAPVPPLFGLAVGEGTGPELAQVFERAVAVFGDAAHTSVRIERSPTLYRSFGGVIQAGLSPSEVARSADEDAESYEAFVRGLVARGCRAVFRTAFNAQPLYAVRERFGAVKVELLPQDGGALMLVRDQSQGFYAGSNNPAAERDEIRRTCRFSRLATYRVLDFAIAEARRHFGAAIDAVVMAYKFHLLDVRFANWVADYARERALDVRVFQPDTMNRNLMRGHYRGKNTVLVGGNEWGDIMHADLLAGAGLGMQDERCSLNVYLAPELEGLREYQTVHGSADDIAGRGRVNPTATLRAAARMLEAHAGLAGLEAQLEAGLREATAAGFATPDVGGALGTDAVAAKVIERTLVARRGLAVSSPACAPDEIDAGRCDTALLVVDMQRDFCAPDGRFAELGLIDPDATAALLGPLQTLLGRARERGLPVLFARTLADESRLAPVVAERHRRHGRAGYLAPDKPGSELFGVEPLPGDEVFTKAGYDAFLGTDLEARLNARGVRHLILAGVFSDVCVDAVARTAYQKGYRVTLISDATLPLERDAREVEAFMTRFYDAAIVRVADLFREAA